MSNQRFLLPDVGEGLTEAEIDEWKVAVGDPVAVNQTIVEIETAKSLVELPSPWAGIVSAVLVGQGATVDVGTPIIEIATGAPASNGGPAAPPVAAAPVASAPATETSGGAHRVAGRGAPVTSAG